MSRATRQEVLIRSLVESLCLTLKGKMSAQPQQMPKILMVDGLPHVVEAVLYLIEELVEKYPIALLPREAGRVIAVFNWFQKTQDANPLLQTPEVLAAMAMGLADRLVQEINNPAKKALVRHLSQMLQVLYDAFDRQAQNMELLCLGAEICDQLLAKEV